MAVMNVFCALITMIGRSGRSFLIRGSTSKAFSSGITTSVMTRSPSPAAIQRHKRRGLCRWSELRNRRGPKPDSGRSGSRRRRRRRELCHSASIKPLLLGGAPVSRHMHWHQDPERRSARQAVALDDSSVVPNHLGNQCKTEATT